MEFQLYSSSPRWALPVWLCRARAVRSHSVVHATQIYIYRDRCRHKSGRHSKCLATRPRLTLPLKRQHTRSESFAQHSTIPDCHRLRTGRGGAAAARGWRLSVKSRAISALLITTLHWEVVKNTLVDTGTSAQTRRLQDDGRQGRRDHMVHRCVFFVFSPVFPFFSFFSVFQFFQFLFHFFQFFRFFEKKFFGLKSTFVVNNDSLNTQHAFSPTVLTICSQSVTDAHAPQWLKKRSTAYCDTQS